MFSVPHYVCAVCAYARYAVPIVVRAQVAPCSVTNCLYPVVLVLVSSSSHPGSPRALIEQSYLHRKKKHPSPRPRKRVWRMAALSRSKVEPPHPVPFPATRTVFTVQKDRRTRNSEYPDPAKTPTKEQGSRKVGPRLRGTAAQAVGWEIQLTAGPVHRVPRRLYQMRQIPHNEQLSCVYLGH
jgi:hypothetical protein